MAGILPRILLFICLSSVCALGFPSASSLCPRSEDSRFLDDVRLQCPLWIERSSPLEVTGEILDRELSHRQSNAYYSVLFYASWCPFSCKSWPTFDALSSMFPQIRHLAVEESSAMPSVLSRYGVHSFPSILIVNRTTRVRYHGSKDLNSLILFYKQTTGLDPVVYLSVDHTISSPRERLLLHPREMLTREPYLAFGLVFLCLKAFLYFFPGIIYQLKTLWALYVWPLNLAVLGESSQLLDRALHVVDMKKLWSKVRLSNKTRNFQKGAKNARVWASSLASV